MLIANQQTDGYGDRSSISLRPRRTCLQKVSADTEERDATTLYKGKRSPGSQLVLVV